MFDSENNSKQFDIDSFVREVITKVVEKKVESLFSQVVPPPAPPSDVIIPTRAPRSWTRSNPDAIKRDSDAVLELLRTKPRGLTLSQIMQALDLDKQEAREAVKLARRQNRIHMSGATCGARYHAVEPVRQK